MQFTVTYSDGSKKDFTFREALTLRDVVEFSDKLWIRRGPAVDRVINQSEDLTASDWTRYNQFIIDCFCHFTGMGKADAIELPEHTINLIVNNMFTMLFGQGRYIESFEYRGETFTLHPFDKGVMKEAMTMMQVDLMLSDRSIFAAWPAIVALITAGRPLEDGELEEREEFFMDLPLETVRNIVFFFGTKLNRQLSDTRTLWVRRAASLRLMTLNA